MITHNSDSVNTKVADELAHYFLWSMCFLVLIQFAFYQASMLGIGLGIASLIIYYVSRSFFSERFIHIVIVSFCISVLCTQSIVQGNGNIALHFSYVIPITIFVLHKNLKAYIPLISFFGFHHILLTFLKGETSLQLFPDATATSTLVIYYIMFIGILLTCLRGAYILQQEGLSNFNLKVKWEKVNSYFNKNILFAKEIASGNWDAEYQIDADNALGNSLLEMRNSLKLTTEDDRNRNWETQGIAKTEEVLRLNSGNIDSLSDGVINTLVTYLGANQGAIFIVEGEAEEDKYLTLKACYAYDKKKIINKRIDLGQGLIGQCVLEKEIIFLTEVPNDYIHITSGLGTATPKCVIIVPLRNDDKIVGAFEIASFTKFQPHQVQFLEKVAESVASAVITSQNNAKTTTLLAASQMLTEKLQTQEEEVRQNVEELQATQEELQRKNSEFEEFMEIFNDYAVRIDFDVKSTITNASSKFLALMHLQKSDIVGKKFINNIHQQYVGEFGEAFWSHVVKNKIHEKDIPFKGHSKEPLWLKCFFKPIEYMPGVVRKVNVIGFAISNNVNDVTDIQNAKINVQN